MNHDCCPIRGCKRKPRAGRKGTGEAREPRLCSTHHTALWRKANPERTAWLRLRQSAQRRGIQFAITFEEWLSWPTLAAYLMCKGRFGDDVQIDRIDAAGPYAIYNIQLLSARENGRKGAHEKPERPF